MSSSSSKSSSSTTTTTITTNQSSLTEITGHQSMRAVILEMLNEDIYKSTFLVIRKSSDTRNDINTIKNNVNSIFQKYFAPENSTLGQLITINDLTSQILSVEGVSTFFIRRLLSDGTTITNNGLTLLSFNPNYSSLDIQIISANLQLPYYKFPFLYNKSILNNIIVI